MTMLAHSKATLVALSMLLSSAAFAAGKATVAPKPGKAPRAAVVRPTPPSRLAKPLIDLHTLERPGVKLKGHRFELQTGGALRFVTKESASRGLGAISVSPKGGVHLSRRVIRPAPKGLAGGASVVEYRFSLPLAAKPGVYKVVCSGAFPSRKDPAWAFSFELQLRPRRHGDPRPL